MIWEQEGRDFISNNAIRTGGRSQRYFVSMGKLEQLRDQRLSHRERRRHGDQTFDSLSERDGSFEFKRRICT